MRHQSSYSRMAEVFTDIEASVRAEVDRLHAFLEGWFRGLLRKEKFDELFADRLHESFESVQPSGDVLSRDALISLIHSGFGANGDFRISITNVRVLGSWPKFNLVHATYVESQHGARNSAPRNDRRSTVLFQVINGRLVWRHIQETNLVLNEG